MKKKLLVLVLAIGTFMSVSASVYAERPIRIKVGGELLKTDVAPVVIDGRVMLPVRAVFEAIDAKVDYVAEEQKVVATKKDTTAIFVIDSNVMTVNGAEKKIDVPATVIDGRTLVPVRACAEAFDLKVEWNGNTRMVKLKKPTLSIVEEYPLGNGRAYVYQCEYDENGNLIYKKEIERDCWYRYTYDKSDNLIYLEYSIDGTGGWSKYEYDENEDLIYWETSSGSSASYEYDEDGNIIGGIVINT